MTGHNTAITAAVDMVSELDQLLAEYLSDVHPHGDVGQHCRNVVAQFRYVGGVLATLLQAAETANRRCGAYHAATLDPIDRRLDHFYR